VQLFVVVTRRLLLIAATQTAVQNKKRNDFFFIQNPLLNWLAVCNKRQPVKQLQGSRFIDRAVIRVVHRFKYNQYSKLPTGSRRFLTTVNDEQLLLQARFYGG